MRTSLAHVLLFNATKAEEQTGPIPMRSVMFTAVRSDSKQKAIRDKARLNAWIARDLAEGFGGKKADYLKMLNGKLKEEFHLCRKTALSFLAQAA